MKLLLALTIVLAVASAKVDHPCHITGYRPPEQPGEPLKFLSMNELPDSWDWSDVNGTDYLTIMR